MDTTVYRSIDGVPASYDRVFRRAADQNIFLSRDWFEVFCATALVPGTEVLMLGAEDPWHGPSALLPLQLTRRHRGLLRPRLLHGLSNFYSMAFEVLTDGCTETTQAALKEIVRRISAGDIKWDVFRIEPLDPESQCVKHLAAAFIGAGHFVVETFHFTNWYEAINGRLYEAYLASRPSRLQNTLRRRRKQLDRAHDWRAEIVDNRVLPVPAVDAYKNVYDASGKSPEMYPALLQRF